MNKKVISQKTNKGFTLIELLVVIAIIALLLSIIMPSMRKVKMLAEEIICKNNIRQYGIATELYLTENKERFPDPWFSLYDTGSASLSFPGENERYCRWHNPEYNLETHPEYAGPYWPYLQTTKASVCPTFAKVAKKYAEYHMEGNGGKSASDCIGGPFEPQFSFSMNGSFRKENGSVKRNQVSSPSQTFLWAEENMWLLNSLCSYVLNDNALVVADRTEAVVDNFASFHKISNSQLASQQDSQQDSHQYGENGVSNVLMLDGSLAMLPPEKSYLYRGKIRGDR